MDCESLKGDYSWSQPYVKIVLLAQVCLANIYFADNKLIELNNLFKSLHFY